MLCRSPDPSDGRLKPSANPEILSGQSNHSDNIFQSPVRTGSPPISSQKHQLQRFGFPFPLSLPWVKKAFLRAQKWRHFVCLLCFSNSMSYNEWSVRVHEACLPAWPQHLLLQPLPHCSSQGHALSQDWCHKVTTENEWDPHAKITNK